jgi:hypothetical protein
MSRLPTFYKAYLLERRTKRILRRFLLSAEEKEQALWEITAGVCRRRRPRITRTPRIRRQGKEARRTVATTPGGQDDSWQGPLAGGNSQSSRHQATTVRSNA